jgi:hypothetical protein
MCKTTEKLFLRRQKYTIFDDHISHRVLFRGVLHFFLQVFNNLLYSKVRIYIHI